MKANENWFSRGKAEADKGIPCGERVVGIAIVVFSVLMVLYFAAHQRLSTGFFTATFGTLEMLALYGFWAFWIVSAGLEGVLGLRLHSRLFDAFGGLIFATIAIAWLILKKSIDLQIPYIDLEMDIEEETLDSLLKRANDKEVKIILSQHLLNDKHLTPLHPCVLVCQREELQGF